MESNKLTYKELTEKGSRLMTEALEHLRKKDYETSRMMREEANKVLDEASNTLEASNMNITKLYGENRNFGIIYNVFEQNLRNMMKTKEGAKAVRKAVKMIQEDKLLKGQFNVYQYLERKSPAKNAEIYVTEALKMIPHSSVKDIANINEKLVLALREDTNFNELVDIDDKTMKFYESVETLINLPQTPDNLDKIVEARTYIYEHIANLPSTQNKDAQNSLDAMYENINKREDNPNAAEFKIFKEITEAKDKKALFEEYKKDVLETIEGIMDSKPDELSEWTEIYESVKNQKFDKRNPYLSIGKLAEIKSVTEQDVV